MQKDCKKLTNSIPKFALLGSNTNMEVFSMQILLIPPKLKEEYWQIYCHKTLNVK